jgi:hypothetical protein
MDLRNSNRPRSHARILAVFAAQMTVGGLAFGAVHLRLQRGRLDLADPATGLVGFAFVVGAVLWILSAAATLAVFVGRPRSRILEHFTLPVVRRLAIGSFTVSLLAVDARGHRRTSRPRARRAGVDVDNGDARPTRTRAPRRRATERRRDLHGRCGRQPLEHRRSPLARSRGLPGEPEPGRPALGVDHCRESSDVAQRRPEPDLSRRGTRASGARALSAGRVQDPLVVSLLVCAGS